MHPTVYYLQAEWRGAELRQEAAHQRLALQVRRARRGAWPFRAIRLPRLSGPRVPQARTG